MDNWLPECQFLEAECVSPTAVAFQQPDQYKLEAVCSCMYTLCVCVSSFVSSKHHYGLKHYRTSSKINNLSYDEVFESLPYPDMVRTFILSALAVWKFFCSDPGFLKFDWKGLFELSWAIVPCLSPRPIAEMEIVYSYILPFSLVTFSQYYNSPSRPVFRARLFQLSSL